MSKILAFAEEIDKQFREKDDQIRDLTDQAEYLACELNKEKTRNSEFRKDLMLLLSKHSNDDWHSW